MGVAVENTMASRPSEAEGSACSRCVNMLVCASLGHVRCAEQLLSEGADVNYTGKSAKDLPVHHAAHHGFLGMLKLLVAHGCDINAQNKIQRNTPLHRAVTRGKHACVSWLVENGAAPSLHVQNRDGETPLSLSTKISMKSEEHAMALKALIQAMDSTQSRAGRANSVHNVSALEIVANPTPNDDTDDENVGEWSSAKSPNWMRLQSALQKGENLAVDIAQSQPMAASKPKLLQKGLKADFMGAIADINDGVRSNRLLAPIRKALKHTKATGGKKMQPNGKLGKRGRRKTAGGLQKRKQRKQQMKRR
eukprot:SAG31_NODE_2120_length_6405_cov_3.062639_7_plen_307_part_00